MKYKSAMFSLACIFTILCLTMPMTFGYVLTNSKWAESSVPVVYTSSVPSAYKTAIGNASKTWSQAGANIAFHNSSSTTNAVNISFVDKLPPMSGEPAPWDAVAGTYNLVYSSNNSRYYSSDIRFKSGAGWSSSVGPDLESVALHEFGHALGLGHTQILNYTKSIMWTTTPPVVNRRNLLSDDIAGIKAKYGTHKSSSINPTGNVFVSASNLSEYEKEIFQRNELMEKSIFDANQIVTVSLYYLPLSDEKLTDQADLIIRGTIKETLPAKWSTSDGLAPKAGYDNDPYSYTMSHDTIVKVDEVFKGNVGDEAVIRQTGGIVDGVAIVDSDSINYIKGDEVLLYLTEGKYSTKESPYYLVVPVQGELLIVNEKAVNPYGQLIDSKYL
jgi:Matrixin.